MRILIVIGELNHRCGPSVHATRLVRELLALGHEPFLCHSTPPGEAEERLVQEFTDTLLPLSHRHPLSPRLALEFGRHLRRVKPDVVVFRLPTAIFNLSHVASSLGVSTLYMAGNVLAYNAKWMQRTLPWLCNRSIDMLAGCSWEVVRTFVEAGYRGPTRRIPLGVEWPTPDQLYASRLRIRNELGYSSGEVVFCTVGRLVPDKRQIHVLQACRELRRRGRPFRLIVVGDGVARHDLESYARANGLESSVQFVGWQPSVFPFLAAADAFVFHSTDTAEGLGAVNLEAAAVGLPLVLADLRCLREIWPNGDGVMFAPVGEANAFADCMERLIRDMQLRQALGAAAAAKVREEYSCSAMGQAYIEAFGEIMA